MIITRFDVGPHPDELPGNLSVNTLVIFVVCLILIRAKSKKIRYHSKITYILVHILWHPYVVQQGDDQYKKIGKNLLVVIVYPHNY